MNFLKRVVVIMIALFFAGLIMSRMDGFSLTGSGWIQYAVMAVILAILNASLLPFLKAMTCGIIILSLGLFSLVLNALVFWLASIISTKLLQGGFSITRFWPALVGSIIVSLTTMLLMPDKKKSSRRDKQDN